MKEPTRKEAVLREAFGSSSDEDDCSPPSASEPPDESVRIQPQQSTTQGFVTLDVTSYSQVRRLNAIEQQGNTGAGLKVLLPEKTDIKDKGRI